jgi:ABC-type spermidine/putrescine transport system permease subunit I
MQHEQTGSHWATRIYEAYRKSKFIWIFAPGVLIVVFFFFIPVFSLFQLSFYENLEMGVYTPAFTLEWYLKFLTDPFYVQIIFFTLRLALTVTFIALLFGFPVAYYIARSSGLKKILCIVLIIVPLWTNLIVRVYGWFVILGQEGFVNSLLVSLNVVDGPISIIFSQTSIIIGLLDMVFPWTLLILISVMEGIDWSMMEAARDLGASRFRSFYEIAFKLSLPGLAVAGLFAFVWAMGDYAVPSLLGSTAQRTISVELGEQILTVLNWPFGASIAFTLLMISVAVLFISNRLSQKGAR